MTNKGKIETFDFLHDQFKKESDRAAVILIAVLIEEKLSNILKLRLIEMLPSQDEFLDDINTSLSTFSWKIDLTYRLGLISKNFARDLHLIRKTRNDFAHKIYDCTFESESVKNRINNLKSSCTIMPFYEYLLSEEHPDAETGIRGIFLFLGSSIIFQLGHILENVERILPSDFNKGELIYGNSDELIMNYLNDVQRIENGEDS